MTKTMYTQTHLVQITSDGEWFVAVSHPEQPNVLIVDTDKNLTFISEYPPEALVAIKPIPALNRYITVRLALIPGLREGSPFNLLIQAVYQLLSVVQRQVSEPDNRLIQLTLLEIYKGLGQGLHEALTTMPTREETAYIEHDFIVHGLQARLAIANQEVEP